MRKPARLGGDLPPEFSRPLIDRTRPLRFRIDGRKVDGFAGDTVLSALLANGIRAAGQFTGSPLALDEYSAPAIALAGGEDRADRAMPMALCPAVDGASFVTLGQGVARQAWLSRFLPSGRDSLGLSYRIGSAEPGGWIDTPPARSITADVAVVGGGVAGLSAALAAAERGLRVCLVEKETTLGGLSVFFGKADGEPAPDDLIGDLARKVEASGVITLLLGTLAFDLHDRTLEVIRVTSAGTSPQPERITIPAETVVLATGMTGRLPLFPGNRLPGVVEAGFAWRMAARYNVWPGESALIHTATNAGYRMALLGAASGKKILRATDPRIDPQTRFIEFCKAYGYRLGWGATIATVSPGPRDALSVSLADAETGVMNQEAVICDHVIVSGGWQPDLDLWIKASGAIAWDADTQRLIPASAPEGVVPAGSAAGYLSLAGCAAHGRVALEGALAGEPRSVPDPSIDPMFETPDGLLMASPHRQHGLPPAFVGPGATGILDTPPARGWARLAGLVAPKVHAVSGSLTPLEIIGEIVAARLDPAFAINLAAERCVLPRALTVESSPTPVNRHASDGLPGYLEHRFPDGQSQWTLTQGEPRRFDPGCLVFANTDHRSPLDAVGVVVWAEKGSVRALMADDRIRAGDIVYVRDGLATIPVRLGQRLVPESDL